MTGTKYDRDNPPHKEGTSVDKRAEELLGRRHGGIPIFTPAEQGYACPICGNESNEELHFSEYNAMLWCKRCDIDIPSCLCVKRYTPNIKAPVMNKKDRVLRAKELFLESVYVAVGNMRAEEARKAEEKAGLR
jgi:hypothetical protein